MTLPEGYQVVKADGARAYAAACAADWARSVLATGTTLYGWASSAHGARTMTGRDIVFSVPAPIAGPEGHQRWVVRHYHRGGAMAPTLGDRYLALGRDRPLHELRLSEESRRRGIPTPAIVAAALYPHGLFYRADLITEEIPDAADLAAILFADARPDVNSALALRAVGGLIHTLANAGLRHHDLHAKNVVLTGDADSLEAHLVDLDRCNPLRHRGRGLTMRRRLERSLRKLEVKTGRPLAAEAWTALGEALESPR